MGQIFEASNSGKSLHTDVTIQGDAELGISDLKSMRVDTTMTNGFDKYKGNDASSSGVNGDVSVTVQEVYGTNVTNGDKNIIVQGILL